MREGREGEGCRRHEARGKRGEIDRHTTGGRKKIIVGRRKERERDNRGKRESCC